MPDSSHLAPIILISHCSPLVLDRMYYEVTQLLEQKSVKATVRTVSTEDEARFLAEVYHRAGRTVNLLIASCSSNAKGMQLFLDMRRLHRKLRCVLVANGLKSFDAGMPPGLLTLLPEGGDTEALCKAVEAALTAAVVPSAGAVSMLA